MDYQPYTGPLYMELADGSVAQIADVTDMDLRVRLPEGDPDAHRLCNLALDREAAKEIVVNDWLRVEYPTDQEAIAAAINLPAGMVVLDYQWEREEYNCRYVVTRLRTGPRPDWWPPAEA